MVEVEKREFQIVREGQEEILKIDCLIAGHSPSLEDDPICMLKTIERLIEFPGVKRIIFYLNKNYIYNYHQTQLLVEISNVYNALIKQRGIWSLVLDPNCSSYLGERLTNLQTIVYGLLKSDPVSAFVEIKRLRRESRIRLKKAENPYEKSFFDLLDYLYGLLNNTALINGVRDELDGFEIGDRSIYRLVFRAAITPDFMLSRLSVQPPLDAEQLDVYSFNQSDVGVYKIKEDIKYLYQLNPPEFKLSEDEYSLLETARGIIREHQPREEDFLEPERVRNTFFNIARDLLTELADQREMDISIEKLNDLASILVRYTIGFGLIEVLLEDEKIQDITINAPVGENPIYVVHQDYGHCFTNIYPSNDDVQGWATKFRILSGRALDEANPILDTELILPKSRARVAIITSPLNPFGLAYAFRRHRDKPWTFPLFMKNKMINSMAAGLLSFLVDGNRSLIFAGTRSSGKCVCGDTLIQFADGGVKKIKDLVGKEKKQIDDGYIYDPISDLSVKSLDKFKISDQKITDVWKRNSPDKLIKIRTKSGKEIITTCEHPYFVYYNGLKNKRADELKIKDLIASPRKLNIEGKEIIFDLRNRPYFLRETDESFIFKGKTNSLEVTFPKKLTSELAEFVGLVLGDGHIDKTKLEFHNSCVELRERYIRLIKMFNVPYRVFKSRTTVVVQVTARVLNEILSNIFEIPLGNKANKIIIPQVILKSKNGVLAAFLRGYFDTEGSVSKDRRMIELVSASRLMIEHLRFALLRFGITTFNGLKIINGVPYYRNYIYGNCVVDFFNNIGFSHPVKKEVLNLLITREYMKNTNVDTIPQGNEIFRLLRKKLRVSPLDLRKCIGKDYWAYENNQYRVTRNWFSKITRFYKERYIKLLSLNEKVNNLRNFVNFEMSNYLNDLNRLKHLLGVSYTSLALSLGLSERGMRGILKNCRVRNINTLLKTSSIINFFIQRLNEIVCLRSIEWDIKTVPVLVDVGVTSYVRLSQDTGIPEATLKYYTLNKNSIPDEREILIENCVKKLKEEFLSNFNEATNLIAKSSNSLMKNINFGLLLSYLKNELNILNTELLSEDVSITTVTNFFIGKSVTTFKVFKSIVTNILKVYEGATSKEVFNLINESEQLSNSDIFWDEISSIDVIDKVDDFVYDLTVENTHNFVANGIIAHNTSLLGSAIAEIMRKYRIVSIEDTLEIPLEAYRKIGYNVQQMKVRSALATGGTEVGADEGIRTSLRMGDSSLIVGEVRSSISGNENVVIIENGETKRIPIKELEGKDIEDIYVPTLDFDLKIKLAKLTGFVKHPKRRKLLKIKTRTGREITVTPDHSLFASHNFKVYPIECNDLKKGSKIVLPARLPCGYNDVEYLNLLEMLPDFRVVGAEHYIRKAIRNLGGKGSSNFVKYDIYSLFSRRRYKKSIGLVRRIKAGDFVNLMKRADIIYDLEGLKIKIITSNVLPAKFPINEDFCRFLGYYLSEGLLELSGNNCVTICNSDPFIIEDLKFISSNLFKQIPRLRVMNWSLGHSVKNIISNSPLVALFRMLGLNKKSYEKRIPNFIFGLSERKICSFLKGLYLGDGYFSGIRMEYATTSKYLAEDLVYLLLCLGIVAKISTKQQSRNALGQRLIYVVEFARKDDVKRFIELTGFNKKLDERKRDIEISRQNVITFDNEGLVRHVFEFKKKSYHLKRDLKCSKFYLKKLITNMMLKCSKELETFAKGDFYLDEVKEVEEVNLEEGEYVYDLSVGSSQNFIGGFGGVLLHNTEAKALYEAMRIGSLANTVAGTIHGESPYGVFDRVVNDLGVPRTSFKATDIIVLSNPVRSPDGLSYFRRVLQITEVRKHWEEDPLKEGGFVDLMKYNPKTDQLEITDDLKNGDSEILKSIAGNVKDWAGNWAAVWDNILLRAKIKQTLLDYSLKLNRPDILEADFVVQANDMFHIVSENVKSMTGVLDSKRIYNEWVEWLKKGIQGEKTALEKE